MHTAKRPQWISVKEEESDRTPSPPPSKRRHVPVDFGGVPTLLGAYEVVPTVLFEAKHITPDFPPWERVDSWTCPRSLLPGSSDSSLLENVWRTVATTFGPTRADWQECFEIVDDALGDAFESGSQERLCEIWERIEQSEKNAEAKMRLLLGKTPVKAPSQPPAWLAEPLQALDAPPNIKRTIAFLAGLIAERHPDTKAELDVTDFDGVEVAWNTERGTLRWIVHSARIPLPGVAVKTYCRVPGQKPTTRSLHTADQVVEHFSRCVGALAE